MDFYSPFFFTPLMANVQRISLLIFRTFVDGRYEHHYTAEEILGYIYAVLHTPTYRSRYAEFLRIDFPRVPFPEAADDFEKLSGLGWALIQAHLLRELPRPGLAAYHGRGDHTVEVVRYSPAEQSIRSTRRNPSSRCRRPCGNFASAAIRCWTNT